MAGADLAVAVIGGGISGLAAAHRLSRHVPSMEITVVEKAESVGGKLQLHDVAGMRLDAGAESVLARRPEATDLFADTGLADVVQHPATSGAGIWIEGNLRPVPQSQLMGIPYSMAELEASNVLDASARRQVAQDAELPITPIEQDVSVGSLVGSRMGMQVVERLVEPLLGGVYAGHASQLSVDMAIPGLLEEMRAQPSLMAAVEQLARRAQTGGPLFASIGGGLGLLPPAVAQASGARQLLNTEVVGLDNGRDRWLIEIRSGGEESHLDADAVVLAVEAPVAGRILGRLAPVAADLLLGVEYASVALVTFVFDAETSPDWPAGTGFLVPPAEGLLTKAATFASQKWGWLADAHPSRFVVRASVGRFADESVMALSDDELVTRVLTELAMVTGVTAAPLETAVKRWDSSLPQYQVGHRSRVAAVREGVEKVRRLELCGAGLDGVGVPACIASGQQAATRLVDSFRQAGQ
jgi:oxygen-dependent protoporphyrinogen oxidase